MKPQDDFETGTLKANVPEFFMSFFRAGVGSAIGALVVGGVTAFCGGPMIGAAIAGAAVLGVATTVLCVLDVSTGGGNADYKTPWAGGLAAMALLGGDKYVITLPPGCKPK